MKQFSYLQKLSVFQKALLFSVLVHILVLGIRFYNPGNIQAYFVRTPLEVILVNAHSQEVPQKPQALAQNSLNGGGQSQQAQRASVPLPYQETTHNAADLENQQARIKSLEALQERLLVQKKAALQMLLRSASVDSEYEGQARQQKRMRLSQQIAAIERNINVQNSRPRLRYLSPSTRSVPYALYYANLRDTIEAKGTNNFPIDQGKKLYGELIMEIVILANGQLQKTTIEQSSGNSVLDKQAQAIVRSIGRFEAFSPAMRKSADLIAIVTRFRFARDGGLKTQLQVQ